MSTVSSTSSTGGNKLRITGMASGLDVDATVKKMIAGEQSKVDKAQQEQQIIEWRQEAYQDIIKEVKDLQNSFFDTANSDKNILSSANFAGFDVTGGTSSVATITAGVGAQTGSYKVSVAAGKLATKASAAGLAINNNTSAITYADANWKNQKIGISINGETAQTITLENSDKSLADRITEINNQIQLNSTLKGKVQVVANADNTAMQIQGLSDSSVKIDSTITSVTELSNLEGRVINPSTSTTLADLGVADSTDSFQITYNGTTKTISVKNTDKLSDIINNISTATSGAVKASFSQLDGKFTIQSANTGSSQSISIGKGTSATGNALAALGITDGTSKTGTDATVTITPPGATTGTIVTKSTNNFTIDGVGYNLTGEGDSTVTVGASSDKVYDKIKGFIDKYNTIVDKIQTKLIEKKSSTSTYKPLTDAQKESMTETQITAWETKCKVGILRNDENLQSMLSSLKSAFTSGVSGAGLTMGKYGTGSIGLDTSIDYSKPAHIDITDPSKLKTAIATNGDQILKMFANVSTSTNKNTKYSESGIFTRIKSIFEDNVGFTNTTLNTAVLTKYANKQDDFSSTGTSGTNTLPDQIYTKQLLITKLKLSLSNKEEAYYQKFSKLETAMNTLNSQSSYISQQFGS